jgi:ppGpp synthetase/RelA/SpoT-type nucleotidyltranferase
VNLADKPPWSKGAVRRLGDALVADCPIPADGPSYDDLMLWHMDLGAEVARIVNTTSWTACDLGRAATSRAKTRDTLVQKLVRDKSLKLDRVQDLAGVRVDASFTLETQLAVATEVAEYFGDNAVVKDIRRSPHSGYRAVHIWLRVPAGNVEIQFRSVAQSRWANTFERVADKYGRDIRYGSQPEDPEGQKLIANLLAVSQLLDRGEQLQQQIDDGKSRPDGPPELLAMLHGLVASNMDRFGELLDWVVETLNQAKEV